MQEMSLYSLFKFYAKNWLLIVSLTLLGLLGGLIYNTYVQTPLYKSDATLLYISPTARSTQDVTLLNNYVQLFNSRRVIEPVMEKLNVTIPFEEIAQSVSAKNEKGTEVLELSVVTKSPELSKAFLSDAIVSFKEQAEALYGADNLSVVDDANDATPPYNVKQPEQLAIATTAGFFVSLVVLFFIYDIKGDTIKPRVKKALAPKAAVAKKAAVVTSSKKLVKKPVSKTLKTPATEKKTTPTVKKPAVSKPAVRKTPVKKKTTAK
jgi:capsular polysaccharide biosynthesis protein